MLQDSLCEASITLISRSNRLQKEENYRDIPDKCRCKTPQQILANQIQQYIKGITYHDWMGFIQGFIRPFRWFNTHKLMWWHHIIKVKDISQRSSK